MLKDLVENLRKQEVVRLRLEGTTIGLRCIRYFPSSQEFKMWDFYLEDVLGNTALYNFLKGISSKLRAIDLIAVDGGYITKEEKEMGVTASELTDVGGITEVVEPLVILYERGYIGGS